MKLIKMFNIILYYIYLRFVVNVYKFLILSLKDINYWWCWYGKESGDVDDLEDYVVWSYVIILCFIKVWLWLCFEDDDVWLCN